MQIGVGLFRSLGLLMSHTLSLKQQAEEDKKKQVYFSIHLITHSFGQYFLSNSVPGARGSGWWGQRSKRIVKQCNQYFDKGKQGALGTL